MSARPAPVIFDCDGVLVDSERISNEVMAAAITRAGFAISAPDARRRWQGKLLAEVGTDVEMQTGTPLSDDFWPRFERDRDEAS